MAIHTHGKPSITPIRASSIVASALRGHHPSQKYIDDTHAAAAGGNPTAGANATLLDAGHAAQIQAAMVRKWFGDHAAAPIAVGAHLDV